MHLRTASPADNEQLAALSRLTPMDGTISICIQRDPDFFSLLYRIGSPHVIIAEEENKIIGCVSIVKEQKMISGNPCTVHYLCDLKVHPDYRNKKIGTKLSRALHEYLLDQHADLLFTAVASNNEKVMPLINGGAGIGNVLSLGKFIILQLVPRKKFRQRAGYTITRFTDEEEIIRMQRQFASRYVLCPESNAGFFKDCIHFAAFSNKEPVAFISLYDPKKLKQNVLVSIPWYYKLALISLRLARPVLHTPRLPATGDMISILYVKGFAHLEGHEDAFLALAAFARQYAWKNNYSFLSIGFHEQDPLRQRFRRSMSFPFVAYGLLTSLKNNRELVNRIKDGIVWKDFSLL